MVKNAMKWATERGLTRTNPVHGKTEYKVPTDETYEHQDKHRSLHRAASCVELEAWWAWSWQFERSYQYPIPSIHNRAYYSCWVLQGAQDLLLGSGANLTAEQASMNLGNTTMLHRDKST